MRILCVCDEGNSRSPTLASMLRYEGHDTLSVGVNHAEPGTLAMLAEWADRIIVTSPGQTASFPSFLADPKFVYWPITDTYPRPFNKELYQLVRGLIREHGLAKEEAHAGT